MGGDSFGGALGIQARALFQDVVDGVIQNLADSHHVHHGCGLIGLRQINPVEVVDVVTVDVVDEEVVDSVSIRRFHAHQPERDRALACSPSRLHSRPSIGQ